MSITLTELAMGVQVFSLLAIGIVVEKHYVSRVTGFTNGIAATVHLLTIPNANPYLFAYAGLGFILGAVGFMFYTLRERTGGWYNFPAFFLYSSLNVFWIVVLPASMWALAIAIGIIGQIILIWLAEDDPTYFDADPFPVDKVLHEIEEDLRMQEARRQLKRLGI